MSLSRDVDSLCCYVMVGTCCVLQSSDGYSRYVREALRLIAMEDSSFIDRINPYRANLTFDEIIEKV